MFVLRHEIWGEERNKDWEALKFVNVRKQVGTFELELGW